jgi:divalent metal cation (Fe/Co/Zn/Cd) transporter
MQLIFQSNFINFIHEKKKKKIRKEDESNKRVHSSNRSWTRTMPVDTVGNVTVDVFPNMRQQMAQQCPRDNRGRLPRENRKRDVIGRVSRVCP